MVKRLVAVLPLIALVSLLAGCVVQSAPTGSGGNTVTMGPNNYIGGVGGGSSCGSSSTPCTVTVKKGQTLTFVDDKSTGSPHILVIGPNGTAKAEAGAPNLGANGMTFSPGDSKPIGPWTTPGTYDVSCSVHPTTMNLKVTVTA